MVVLVVVLFPFGDMTKERASCWLVLSSWVAGLLCKTGLSVLVKFVVIGLYFFVYTFIRV